MTKVLNMTFLGTMGIHFDEEPVLLVSAKAQALLSYLAVSGRIYSRQALAGLLWGNLPEADARRNLRGVIMKLRQDFDAYLEVTHHTIAFDKTSPHLLDATKFRDLCQQGDVASLEQAVILYRGDFLEDLHIRQAPSFEEWVMQQREVFRQDSISVCHRLIISFDAQNRFEDGIRYARRLLMLDVANEEGHRLLMALLAKSGQRSSALAQYEVCERVLAEIGVAPMEETAVLLHQIRTNNLVVPTRSQPEIVTTVPVSPERPPFLAGPPITHSSAFFGRQRELKRILNLLRYLPMQNGAIIGPRRSGKTSLLHHLKNASPLTQHNWIFVDFQDKRMGARSYFFRYLLEQMKLPLPESCDLESFMDVVSDELQEPTVILMDEIGVALQRYPELDETFWESLRSLATNQVGGQLGFVLAGAEAPGQLAQQSGMGSPFFNIFGYVATLGALTEPEARGLIASAPIPFPEDDVEWILLESARWPILLQILCQERLLSLEEGETDLTWREEALEQLSPFLYLKETTK